MYFKRHFSHSEVEKEGSLKFFLQKCSFNTCHIIKCEKYIQRRKIFFLSIARNMREIAHYCIIDALWSPLLKRGIVKRSFLSSSFFLRSPTAEKMQCSFMVR